MIKCFPVRESCNEALDVMVENVTVLRAAQVVVGGGFGHKSVVVRTTVARLLDKIVTQLGAERVMGSSKEFQASQHSYLIQGHRLDAAALHMQEWKNNMSVP